MTRPVLHTERLVLHPPAARHLPVYLDWYAEDRGATGRYAGPLPPQAAWNELAKDIGHWELRGFGMWIVERRADGVLLGGTGLYLPEGWPSHELTWWLLPAARGTGIATEASRAVIAHAYDSLGWQAVETHMQDTNAPARRLAERLGGRVTRRQTFPDGIARDVFRLPHPDMEPAS